MSQKPGLFVSIPQQHNALTPRKPPQSPPFRSPPQSPLNSPIGDVECQRRESLKRRIDLVMASFQCADADELAKLVKEGLSDSWSEIRGDTAKALSRHCESSRLPVAPCRELISGMLVILLR